MIKKIPFISKHANPELGVMVTVKKEARKNITLKNALN